jgi:hypothetical protein
MADAALPRHGACLPLFQGGAGGATRWPSVAENHLRCAALGWFSGIRLLEQPSLSSVLPFSVYPLSQRLARFATLKNHMLDRRSFLAAGGAAAALAALGLPQEALAANGLQLSQPTPFSFDALVAQAKSLAAKPYVAAVPLAPEVLERIDYDAHGKIKFDPANALFRDGPGAFPVTFFHLGRFFQTPVRMHVLENTDGDAFSREVLYNASYFSMPPDSPARALPPGAGFAGFRLQESRLGDQASSTGRRTTGSPSWAPRTSAPSASSTSTACRHAASRSTWRCPTSRKSSRPSRASTSRRRRPATPPR